MSNLTTNTFQEGLLSDLNPLITPSNVMTNCLNGTLITYNGNENVLLNDMGNGRVETAFLPEGYVPLGTCELGGIIYIVSYNPIIDKCLIGSFPSPERNILLDEIPQVPNTANINFVGDFAKEATTLTTTPQEKSDTLEGEQTTPSYSYTTVLDKPFKRILLLDRKLYPGDLFKIYSENVNTSLSILSSYNNSNKNPNLDPRYLKLNVISVEDNGTITNLNKDMVWDSNYYIAQGDAKKVASDVDEYRKLVGGGYTPFMAKTSGRIGILALLEAITNFDCAWDAIKKDNKWHIYFYTNWEYENEEAKDKINLYGIKVECDKEFENNKNSEHITISKYPSNEGLVNTNILDKKPNIIFYSPEAVNLEDDSIYNGSYEQGALNGNVPRKNNGDDNLFLITTPIILPEKASGIYTFEVSPMMPYGTLDYLKKTFTIDIDKLGTGAIELKEYRYLYNDTRETVTLNWGINVYPERRKNIQKVEFNFYNYSNNITWISEYADKILNKYTINGIWKSNVETLKLETLLLETLSNTEITEEDLPNTEELPTIDQPLHKVYTKTINQSSYNGNFVNILDFNKYDDGQLNKYSVYLVEIVIHYGSRSSLDEKLVRYYRIMYTTDIFNDYYTKEDDFKKINLSKVLFDSNNYSYKMLVTSTLGDIESNELYLSNSYNGVMYDLDYSKKIDSIDSFIEGKILDKTYVNKIEQSCALTPEIKITSKFKKVYIERSGTTDKLTMHHSLIPNSAILNPYNCIISNQSITPPRIEYNSTEGKITTYIPIKCIYNKRETKVVPYKMMPLTSANYFMSTNHLDKNSSTYLRYSKDSGNLKEIKIGTDITFTYSNQFDEILMEDLKYCDYIHLKADTTGHEDLSEHAKLWVLMDNGYDYKKNDAGVVYNFVVLNFNRKPLFTFCGVPSAMQASNTDWISGRYKIVKVSDEVRNGYSCFVVYYPNSIMQMSCEYPSDIKETPIIKVNLTKIESNNKVENLNITDITLLQSKLKDTLYFTIDSMSYVTEIFNKDYSKCVKVDNEYKTELNTSLLYLKNDDGTYEAKAIPQLSSRIQDGLLEVVQRPTDGGIYVSSEEKNSKHLMFEMKVYRVGANKQ